jgi:hypothetical protein
VNFASAEASQSPMLRTELSAMLFTVREDVCVISIVVSKNPANEISPSCAAESWHKAHNAHSAATTA